MSKLEQLLKQQQEINAAIEAEKTKCRLKALATGVACANSIELRCVRSNPMCWCVSHVWAKMEQLWQSLLWLTPNVVAQLRNNVLALKNEIYC